MPNDARNLVLIATGRKRSGKSHLLDMHARQFPRRLVLDFTGEHQHDVPAPLVAWSLRELGRLLARVADRPRWHIVAELVPDDVPQLLAWLIPAGRGVGYSLAVGGMVLECGELNEFAPNRGNLPREVAVLFSRGRHQWLSVLGAARRATEINLLATSQADVICAFRQHQESDVRRIAELMGERAVPQLQRLARWEYLRYFVDDGRLELVHANGRAELIPDSL